MEAHRKSERLFDRVIGTTTIAYCEQGDKTGIPLVFLHGIASSKEPLVKGVFPHLPAFIRAIAWDLPGFGESSPLKSHGLLEAAHTLRVLLDALSIERAHLYGMSLGGATATVFYGHFPKRVSSLTLQGAPVQLSLSKVKRALLWAIPTIWFLRLVNPSRAVSWLEGYYGKRDCERIERGYPHFREVIARDLDLMTLRAAYEYGVDVARINLQEEYYSSIHVPTLLIDGTEVMGALNTLYRLHVLIPHAHVHRVDNAGHLATLVATEEVVGVLLNFIQSVVAKEEE